MKKTLLIDIASDDQVEDLLAEAGFSFDVVAACPAPDCQVCARHDLTKAA